MDCLKEFDAKHLGAETKGVEYYRENMVTRRKLKNCCKRWSDDKNSRDFLVNHENEIDENSFFKIIKNTWNLLFFNEEKKGKLLYGEGDEHMYTLPNFLIMDPLSSGVISPFDSDQVGMSLDEGEDIGSEHVQVDNEEDVVAICSLEGGNEECLPEENTHEDPMEGDNPECEGGEKNGNYPLQENNPNYSIEGENPHCAPGQTWDEGFGEDEHWDTAIRASPVREENSNMENMSSDKESRKKMRTCKKSIINKKYINIYHKHDDSYSFHDKEIDDFLILSDVPTGVSDVEEGNEQNRVDVQNEVLRGEPSDNGVSSGQGCSISSTGTTANCPNPDVHNPAGTSEMEEDPPQPGLRNEDT
ncbi:conserved Plasmodium protein, unknown function [Plasmodium knowlesi strain H]|uniref:Uncharacterized protein n=3 Tax=Plasmodium knowlesi TaxID=5850 RepID=A0A5K1VJN4_PLAKH|nr:conserved Plasmodium protein, unknown function [Plasmodium knowlesi strain H]OTN65699.1 Uncharacterized protein PKNOH_S110076600 [Plasmodium knowlesi]CAA9989387.1 conserved Plasmodium protein, unknown function [Plasmodium knowlesi strain H]SBO24979.1 conserved Plasmodium protein, unknown function [Plasmodium knowlesi strain H]SBO27885.1 conserved Plasmodium protein, unknown function [Plasmodium knowlesi strain H]VVS78861.1 conserved Plasmodium protein, unknown function [Plasmodium knowlesi |eukprot:XP_002260114.1 hypothetical protein, conserved in Plasmodium species [Plasmodium knowlesi strain H]